MCFVAETHSSQVWTTIWLVTVYIAFTEILFATTSSDNVSSLQCFQGDLKSKCWCENGLCPNNKTNSKNLFSCFFALSGISKLGRNLGLAISWLLAMPSKCCVVIWCHSCIRCFDMLSITSSVAQNSFFATLAFGNFSESTSCRGQRRLLWRCCHLFWRMSLGMCAIANGGYGVLFLR